MDTATDVRESEQELASTSGRPRVERDRTAHFLMTSNHAKIEDVLSNVKSSFEKSKERVNDLLKIHTESGGTDPGKRPPEFAVLNMSAIVLITACWESYLGTLLRDAFIFLLDSSDNPEKISNTLKKNVSDEIKKNSDDRRVWELTGDGWKDILKKKVKEKLDKFGSPSGKRSSELFKQILNLDNLSECWLWQKMDHNTAVRKLDEFLLVRNKIAHGEEIEDRKVGKSDVKDYLNHVERLVEKTEKKVECHIKNLLEN